ncbi:MAG: M15 family metallopeptidase, partial [Oscillospiraceae bacterium]|nr:M15 family metallopeptidase [Oscillospiraceae bacterium]
MPTKEERSSKPQRRRLRPSVKILAVAVVVLLLVLAGFRLYKWQEQRGETRVIVLVNRWNDIDNSGFVPRLKTVEGVQVDRSCAKALQQMLSDCRAAGGDPVLSAGARSRDEQLALFNNEMDRQVIAGRSSEIAYAIAEQKVGAPGTSEHELGLAVDIQGVGAQNWLKENCWRYGFILRYPPGSEEITGRSADPAHFRYVGVSAAEQIFTLDITLEEY